MTINGIIKAGLEAMKVGDTEFRWWCAGFKCVPNILYMDKAFFNGSLVELAFELEKQIADYGKWASFVKPIWLESNRDVTFEEYIGLRMTAEQRIAVAIAALEGE
jgi:hypothetical protein